MALCENWDAILTRNYHTVEGRWGDTGGARDSKMTTGIIHSKVRGVNFENRQELIKRHVRPGMRLAAIRELQNPHGSNAIGLWAGKVQIGHLSSDLADELAPYMDHGGKITVTVIEFTGGGPGESIGVNIVIDKNAEEEMNATTKPQLLMRHYLRWLLLAALVSFIIGLAFDSAVFGMVGFFGLIGLGIYAWRSRGFAHLF